MKRLVLLLVILCTLSISTAQQTVSFQYDIQIPMSERFSIYVFHSQGDLASGDFAEDYFYVVDNSSGMRIFYDQYRGNASETDITFSQNVAQSDQFHESWNIKIARDFMDDVEFKGLLLPLTTDAQTLIDQ